MTRFLKGADGLLYRADGTFIMSPDTAVTVPTITLIGQARPNGMTYEQEVSIPTPPDGMEWWLYRPGTNPRMVEPGVQFIEVGTIGVAFLPTVAYLLGEGGIYPPSRQFVIRPNFPSVQPFVIAGVASITTDGYVGGPFSASFPTIVVGTPASPPIQRLDLYTSASTPTIDSSTTTIPSTVPEDWESLWVSAYWSVVDPGSDPQLREYASPRAAIAALTTAAPLASDILMLRSVYRPDGQTATFSPIFALTDPAKASWQVRFRSGPVEVIDAAYGNTAFVPGTDGERRLSDFTDPLYPGQNFALYRAGEARNGRLRFSWRPSDSAPWSADSPLFAVPSTIFVEPFVITGTPTITTGGQVGDAFAVAWPVITSGTPSTPPVQRIDLYASATSTAILSSTTTIPSTVPSSWSGLFVVAYWSVNDPGTTPPLRELSSPRREIAVGATVPPTASEISILRSEYRPPSQTATYSPIFSVTSGKATWQVRFRAGPTEDVGAAYGNTEANPTGGAGERRLSDFTDPAFPGQNFALFRPGQERNGRLRFSWRPSTAAPWSGDGDVYDVPPLGTGPDPDDDEVIFGTATAGSAASLKSLIRAAPGGTSVLVPPGTYTPVEFNENIIKTGGSVRVRASDPNNPPVIRRITWERGRIADGIFLDGLNIIGNSFQPSPNTDNPAGYGIRFESGRNFRIENCKIQGHDVGIRLDRCSNCYIGWNEFSKGGMDTIRGLNGGSNLTIEHNNFIFNPDADIARAKADLTYHLDHIQIDNTSDPGWLNLTIQDNKFTTTNDYHQNFYLASQLCAFNPLSSSPPISTHGHRNTKILRNRMECGWASGIMMSGHHNFLLEGNLLRQIDGPRAQETGFYFAGPNSGTVRNNVYPSVTYDNESTYRTRSQGLQFFQSGKGDGRPGPWGDDFLSDFNVTGNQRSDTAFPSGWVEPRVGPYNQP